MNVFDDELLRQCLPISLSKSKPNHHDHIKQIINMTESKVRNLTEKSVHISMKKKSSSPSAGRF